MHSGLPVPMLIFEVMATDFTEESIIVMNYGALIFRTLNFLQFGGNSPCLLQRSRSVKFCEIEIASLRSLVTGAMLKCRHREGRSGEYSGGDPKQSHNFVRT
jgi:hypothetical protein